MRAGTGHNYWDKFTKDTQSKIESLGGEIYKLFFEPALELPHKTLDVPIAGQGYGPHVLPLLFDFLHMINESGVPDSSHKRLKKDDELPDDLDGAETIKYLSRARQMAWRLCSMHASSLGLHPALYFYSPSGIFQPTALLSFVALFKDYDTPDFWRFIKVRANFEAFVMEHRGITEAVRQLGSGSRSRPRMIALYRTLIDEFEKGATVPQLATKLAGSEQFKFLFSVMEEEQPDSQSRPSSRFSRDTKGAAYLRDALPIAPKCPTCGGLMHRNGMQVGHVQHRRDGGVGIVENAMMQHPFCNSTVAQ